MGKRERLLFADESFGLNGPYSTLQDAVIALDQYVDYLNNGPKAVNGTGNLPQCNVKYYGD